jgi:hypothetical protein
MEIHSRENPGILLFTYLFWWFARQGFYHWDPFSRKITHTYKLNASMEKYVFFLSFSCSFSIEAE